MNASIATARHERASSSTAPRGPQAALAPLAALALFAGAACAQTSSDAPWVIDGASYFPDPGYNNGLYGADAFAGSESLNYRAKKLVSLDNGDVIVAAIVPPASGGANAVNLGLVRYDASGHRVAWTNPTPAYAVFGNQYIVYPNVGDANNEGTIIDVKDIKRVGDRVFVLVDHPFAGTADTDSYVIVFGTDGQFLANDAIVSTTFAEIAGGIVVYSDLQLPETISLAYAGTTIVSDGTERPTYRHFTVNADSSLEATTDPVYITAGNLCDSLHDCELHGIAAGGNLLFPPSRFYLAGGHQFQGDDWDYLIYAVTPDGSPATSFSDDGARTYAFDAGGNAHDVANTISVSRGISADTLYLAGEVAQDCEPGVGVIALDDAGTADAAFGASGEVIVGGSTDSGSLCALHYSLGSARADFGIASVLDSGKLAVVGFNVYGPGVLCTVGNPCPEDNVDGELIVLNAASGVVDSFLGYAFSSTPGGPRSRHTGLWGVVGDGDGTFTAAGDARFFQAAPGDPAGAMQVSTIRLTSGGDDTIFADGFGP